MAGSRIVMVDGHVLISDILVTVILKKIKAKKEIHHVKGKDE